MKLTEKMTRCALKIGAATQIRDAKLHEFFASCSVGSSAERQEAKDAVLAATEALLDAQEEHAWFYLMSQGIDPETRDYQTKPSDDDGDYEDWDA
jgi:hypothetical protein